jgi:hypothetical protein
MIRYQYQIIRYVHDQVTQEFANVGVIVYEPNMGLLTSRVTSRYARITEFFTVKDGHLLAHALKNLQRQIKKVSELIQDKTAPFSDDSIRQLEKITNSILVKDDSALVLTTVKEAIDIDVDKALQDLYERMVERYEKAKSTNHHTDSEVWRTVYKNYFDQVGITNKLSNHSITANTININFDKAWKNGVWHCYQPLTFNLQSSESIQNKAFKWSGIVKALEAKDESLNLYFLTTSPKDHEDMKAFIHETLMQETRKIHVEIIEEKDAEQFANKVKQEMEKSNIDFTDQ